MAAGEKINQLPSGSPNDNSLGILADPQTGKLYQTGYKDLKNYFQQGVIFNTGSFVLTASYNQDSGSFNTRINNIFSSQSSYVQLSLFNIYTGSIGTQILNVYASESNYLSTASFTAFSSSVNTRFNNITGSGGSGSTSQVLNFIVGDGQSFTPASGSTVFSSSVIFNKTIIQLSQEGTTIAPVSRSVAWFSVTSSAGKLNLNNTSFVPDVFYQIIYT